MKKQTMIKWDERCEVAFLDIKVPLATSIVMVKPISSQKLQLYLLVLEGVINTTLIEEASEKRLIYFISSVL